MLRREVAMGIDISKYQGIGQFGCAYQVMMKNDTHAPGSVDRVLTQRMIRLCQEIDPYLYEEYSPTSISYEKGERPELESRTDEVVAGCQTAEEKIEKIVKFTSGLGKEVEDESLDEMRFGGLEEEITIRGSDWCTDVARVACVMCQVAGLPTRLVMLYNTQQAYSGHQIIEIFRDGIWGAVDSSTATIYHHVDGRGASTWELMNQPDLIEVHRREDGSLPAYTRREQFNGAAISNYFFWDCKQYDYAVSRINGYCRSILEMSEKGWPGGLRWLHCEDSD